MRINIIMEGMIPLLFVPFLLQAEPTFTPGNSEINEKDILSRMVQEIGDGASGQEKAVVLARTGGGKPVQEIRLRKISVSLQNGTRFDGPAVLSQRHLVLHLDDRAQAVAIPLNTIQSVTFADWKPSVFSGQKAFFLPERCEVKLKDGETISGKPEMQDWLQLTLPGGAVRTYYAARSESSAPPTDLLKVIEFSHEDVAVDAPSNNR